MTMTTEYRIGDQLPGPTPHDDDAVEAIAAHLYAEHESHDYVELKSFAELRGDRRVSYLMKAHGVLHSLAANRLHVAPDTQPIPDEPPIGATVRNDRGACFDHMTNGNWKATGSPGRINFTWDELWARMAPFTVIYLPRPDQERSDA